MMDYTVKDSKKFFKDEPTASSSKDIESLEFECSHTDMSNDADLEEESGITTEQILMEVVDTKREITSGSEGDISIDSIGPTEASAAECEKVELFVDYEEPKSYFVQGPTDTNVIPAMVPGPIPVYKKMSVSHRNLDLPSFSKIVPKRKSKSCVWKYFGLPADENGTVLSTDISICNVCKSPVSSKSANTTNLFSHLKRYHPLKYSEMPNKLSEVPRVICDPGEPQEISEQTGHSIIKSFGQTVKRQKTTLDFQPLDNHTTKEYTDSVTKYLAMTMHSYNTVEQKSFIDMLKVFNPSYKLPGRKYFSIIAVPKLYSDTKEKIRQELTKISGSPVAVTIDCWASICNIPYIGVTAHFISSDWALKSIWLSCAHFEKDHTYKNVIEVLENILTDWDISVGTISACTTDNGSNIVKAIERMKLNHIACFGYNMNVGINQALELPEISKVVRKVKQLQNTITHNQKMRQDLINSQKLLNQGVKSLPSACPTRWWSTSKLIKMFLDNQVLIYKMILDHHPDKKHLLLEINEIDVLEKFVSATKLLEDMSKTLSEEDYITSSCILPLYGQIKKLLISEGDNQLMKDIKDNILQALKKYEIEPLTSTLKLSSLCDPRFRLHYIESPEEVKKIAIEKMTAIYKTRGDDKHTKEFDIRQTQEKSPAKEIKGLSQFFPNAAKNENANLPSMQAEVELNNYLVMPAVGFDQDPLQWWKSHHSSFPALTTIAKHYLAIQATSVPPGRVFSAGKNIIDKQRASLSPKNTEIRIFLAQNKEYIG